MEEVARVVLALEEHDVAEEVMHFLDRTGRARVVATASDEHQLSEAVRQLEPDAVVASPVLANSAQLNGTALLAVDTSETVQTLRRALKAGAKGFFLWPADRGELARATARVLAPGVRERETLGRVVAVHGPRGGDIPRHPPRGGLRTAGPALRPGGSRSGYRRYRAGGGGSHGWIVEDHRRRR